MNCPVCGADLDQDFGMVTCGSCKAVLMIDISGQIQVGSDSSPVSQDHFAEDDFSIDSSEDQFQETTVGHESDFEPIEEFNENHDEAVEAQTSEDEFEEMDDQSSTGEFHAIEAEESEGFQAFNEESAEETQDNFFSADEDEPIETSFEEEPLQAQEQVEHEVSQEVELPDDNEEIESFAMASEPDKDPVNITEFGNSQESNLEDGELLYDLIISRLDSKDLRETLKYVLLDEKLKLNHHEFLKKIKNGQVVVPDLNPIKAKRMVEQLQFSDLDIKWKQKRVIIEAVEPEFDEEGEEAEIMDDAEL